MLTVLHLSSKIMSKQQAMTSGISFYWLLEDSEVLGTSSATSLKNVVRKIHVCVCVCMSICGTSLRLLPALPGAQKRFWRAVWMFFSRPHLARFFPRPSGVTTCNQKSHGTSHRRNSSSFQEHGHCRALDPHTLSY